MLNGTVPQISKSYEGFIGRKFGRWTVVEFAERKGNHHFFKCTCNCGTVRVVRGASLRLGRKRGGTVSCGCYQRELATKHTRSRDRVYRIYKSMINRCYTESSTEWGNYGSRGITVCDRWRESFVAFLNDMGDPTTSSHTLDRINVNGNYEQSNCRWATQKEQQRNRRNNHIISLNGRELCLSAWAEEYGLTAKQLDKRIRLGWDSARAITTPIDQKRSLLAKQG